MRFRHLLHAGLAMATAAGLVACDSEVGTTATGLEVNIYTVPQAADPFEGVSIVRLVMEGDGLAGAYTQLIPYAPGGQGVLDGVPFSTVGQLRQLMIEGWAAGTNGQPTVLVSRGRSLPVEVIEGQPPQSLDVLLARVNHFLPLVSVNTLAAQRLATGRIGHTVSPTDSGEVVIVGGGSVSAPGAQWWKPTSFDQLHKSVESLDRWTHTIGARSPMLQPRAFHSALALSSGQVILAGGYVANGDATRDIELYNPPGVLDGTAKPLQPLAVARAGHSATLIDAATRTILFVGGDDAGTWELWNPVDGSQGTRAFPDTLQRRFHTATRFFLAGRIEPAVLIAGGESDAGTHATAMLYDSVAKNMVPMPQPMPSGARTQLTATLVDSRGFVYLAGGFTDLTRTSTTAGIDVFDVATQQFIAGNEGFRMRTARGGHAAALLPNNTVVLTGGFGSEPGGQPPRPLGSIEVIHEFLDASAGVLKIEVASSWNPEPTAAMVPYMPVERVGHQAIALDNGMTLLVGGAAASSTDGGSSMVMDLTLYNPL